MKLLGDLWFCSDCVMPAVYGDHTSLDYYYDEEEATLRMVEIEAGLMQFSHGHLQPTDDTLEFSNITCDCCGARLAGQRVRFELWQ